jgi:oxygen-dependent protoporphyrinogen oxidase
MQLSGKRVAVIGGGISGLAAARRLHELEPSLEITLLESSSRLGGVLETIREDGFLIERGADNFITTIPYGIDLCRRLGIEDQLLQTTSEHRTAFVVRRGRLHKIPEGFVIMAPSRIWPVIATPILSPVGKLRMACEYFIRPDIKEDESLASFVRRRFGRETYERLVQPLVGGIYTGDPDKLSLRSTMPRFHDMEKNHGSLIRAIWKQAKKQRDASQGGGARYSMFVAPRDGMASLVDTIAARLPAGSIRLSAPVQSIRRRDDGMWMVSVRSDPDAALTFDAVILATKSQAAAGLVGFDQQLAELLSGIPHASCSIVSLGYRREQVAHRMDGFGFVVPQAENRKVISGSFSSVKYPGRAPEGHVLLRAFIGGAFQADLAKLPDDQLIEIATGELRGLMGVQGEPMLVRVSRYLESMPQYYVGHTDRVKQIERAADAWPGLHFTGSIFTGVGIPFCIHHAEQIAGQVVAGLGSEQGD